MCRVRSGHPNYSFSNERIAGLVRTIRSCSVTHASEGIKDPTFSKAMDHADGLIIVAPEYNQGIPFL